MPPPSTLSINPNHNTVMSSLAIANESKIEAAKPFDEVAKHSTTMDSVTWRNLVGQLRSQFRDMTTDECYSRVLELTNVALSEAGSKDVDPGAIDGPIVKNTQGEIIPISPIKLSRTYSSAAIPAKPHVHQAMTPQPRVTPPKMTAMSPPVTPLTSLVNESKRTDLSMTTPLMAANGVRSSRILDFGLTSSCSCTPLSRICLLPSDEVTAWATGPTTPAATPSKAFMMTPSPAPPQVNLADPATTKAMMLGNTPTWDQVPGSTMARLIPEMGNTKPISPIPFGQYQPFSQFQPEEACSILSMLNDAPQHSSMADHTSNSSLLCLEVDTMNYISQQDALVAQSKCQGAQFKVTNKWTEHRSRCKSKKGPKQRIGKPLAGIANPSPVDVLSGRGGHTNHHVGNMKFRSEVIRLRIEYQESNDPKKKYFLTKVKKSSNDLTANVT